VNKHNTIVLRGVSFFKVHLLGITGMLLKGYNEFISTIHYNLLFFIWLIMNCFYYKN